MTRYVCSKSVYEVNDRGEIIQNGKKLQGLMLVGGVIQGAKLQEQNLDFTIGYKLAVRVIPEKNDSLFYLPRKAQHREDGWERLDPFHVFISKTLYEQLKERQVTVASSPIKEISETDDASKEFWSDQ